MSYSQHQNNNSRPNNSYLDQMSRGEKILAIIGFLALIGDGFPIAVLILFYIAYSVSERNRLKVKISNVIIQNPEISVHEIARLTEVSVNKATDTLKMMILIDGEPIQFNLVTGHIKKMGRLFTEPRSTTTKSEVKASPVPTEEDNVTEETAQEVTQATPEVFNCFQCGAELPLIAQYCNDCGVRQSK